MLSVLVAAVISVVMLWFPDFWSFSALALRSHLGAGTHEDAVVFRRPPASFSFPLGSLCYPVSFVCAAGNLSRITSNTHPP